MFSGATAADPSWKTKEQSEEARYAHEKEQSHLTAIRERIHEQEESTSKSSASEGSNAGPTTTSKSYFQPDFEGGFGGQEDLEDRYATTSGEH